MGPRAFLRLSFPAALCLFSLGAGCSGGKAVPDAGVGDGGGDFPPEEPEITVSGVARIHPEAVKYLLAASLAPATVDGLTLRVEEPLKVALNDPQGIFGVVTLTDAGTFSVNRVPTQLINLGIAAGIIDPGCGADGGSGDGGCSSRVIRSATVLWDVAIEGHKPETDVTDGRAYVIPTAFHDALTRTVTEANIRRITANQKGTLVEAGFILGRVVDSAGQPVAGATLAPVPNSLSTQLFYPAADLSGLQASTSASGLFLFVHTGGDVKTFKFSVQGHPEYLNRTAGAAPDACLVITVYPGLTQP